MNHGRYRRCAVTSCKNSSVKTPEKLFARVPEKIEMRNVWLQLAKRDPRSLSRKSRLYLCEDHFDLENDMEDYIKYKIMGSIKRVKMKENVTPSRFYWTDHASSSELGCEADQLSESSVMAASNEYLNEEVVYLEEESIGAEELINVNEEAVEGMDETLNLKEPVEVKEGTNGAMELLDVKLKEELVEGMDETLDAEETGDRREETTGAEELLDVKEEIVDGMDETTDAEEPVDMQEEITGAEELLDVKEEAVDVMEETVDLNEEILDVKQEVYDEHVGLDELVVSPVCVTRTAVQGTRICNHPLYSNDEILTHNGEYAPTATKSTSSKSLQSKRSSENITPIPNALNTNLDTESDEHFQALTQKKLRRQQPFVDSEVLHPSEYKTDVPIAATLRSFLSRKTTSGYIVQTNHDATGDYYVELRVFHRRAEEAFVTFNGAVSRTSPIFGSVCDVLKAAKDEYQGIKPVIYEYSPNSI